MIKLLLFFAFIAVFVYCGTHEIASITTAQSIEVAR